MTRRRHLLVPAVLLLLAAAWALPLPDAPVGDEATYLLAAASLWHDGDLRYDSRDLARGYRTWSAGPRGLALIEDGDSLAFARPFLYPVVAAPFYGLLGPRGVRVLGMALFLGMLQVARRRLLAGRTPSGTPPPREERPALSGRAAGAGLLLAAFFFASAAVVWTLRFEPAVLLMAFAFFTVALWCRVRCEPLWGRRELLPLAGAGGLLAAAALHEPALALLAVPVAVDLVWSRRWKAAAVFVLALLGPGLALAGLQERLTGAWGPSLEEETRTYAGPFPREPLPAVEEASGAGGFLEGAEVGEGLETGFGGEGATGRSLTPELAGRRLLWLAVGRHVGVVPYFPFAVFVLGLYLADLRCRGGRSRHLLAGALLIYGVLAVLGLGGGSGGWAASVGPSAPGARSVALVYPLLLFLPRRLRGGRALVLPFAAAGLWLAPALAGAVSGALPGRPQELPGTAATGPSYRVLPLELELLSEGRLPGYAVLYRSPEGQGGPWLVPRDSWLASERHPEGVWVRGASRSEVYLVAREPVDAVRFTARSISAESELVVTGVGRLRARFDSEGKRAGVPVEIRPELVARGLGLFLRQEPGEERIYRLVLEVTGGAVPARVDPASRDPRYLGVFLAF